MTRNGLLPRSRERWKSFARLSAQQWLLLVAFLLLFSTGNAEPQVPMTTKAWRPAATAPIREAPAAVSRPLQPPVFSPQSSHDGKDRFDIMGARILDDPSPSPSSPATSPSAADPASAAGPGQPQQQQDVQWRDNNAQAEQGGPEARGREDQVQYQAQAQAQAQAQQQEQEQEQEQEPSNRPEHSRHHRHVGGEGYAHRPPQDNPKHQHHHKHRFFGAGMAMGMAAGGMPPGVPIPGAAPPPQAAAAPGAPGAPGAPPAAGAAPGTTAAGDSSATDFSKAPWNNIPWNPMWHPGTYWPPSPWPIGPSSYTTPYGGNPYHSGNPYFWHPAAVPAPMPLQYGSAMGPFTPASFGASLPPYSPVIPWSSPMSAPVVATGPGLGVGMQLVA